MRNRKEMDWTATKIRIALLQAGVAQAAIAREIGVQPQAVYKVIEGLSASDRIRRAIAASINKDVREIWPSIYLGAGPRGRGRPKATSLKR